MVLQFYANAHSTCAQRVATVLFEKQIPYEWHNVDFAKGEHKAPEYIEKQPFGQVPYIASHPLALLPIDDGFVLFESRAIGRYLAHKYADKGPKLIPASSDLKATALFEQAASIEQSNFDAFASKACFENIFKTWRGLSPDPKVFEETIAQLDAKLKAYEVILGKQKYLAGDEVTLADLFHLPYGSLLAAAGSDIMSKQGPNVTRWWNDITSRPSWQAIAKGVPATPTY
ncbi:hypothetical protein V5O48_007711 [Marasmius crinis-equi]|uniref:glutathione transferase n=1 Tax=Marasmius crinis-equi TaxID=585013 RepID=A0ABR3FG23_9AGAR